MRLLLFLSVTIAVVLLIIVVFFMLSASKPTAPLSENVPTPSVVPINNSQKDGGQKTIPQLRFDSQKIDKLIDLSNNRRALSTNGETAKTKIIKDLGGAPGIPYSSGKVSLEYLPAGDLFQGMIKSMDIKDAKEDLVEWLLLQGFTRDDVCKLPLGFYTTPQVSSGLKSAGIIFDPLPEGC